MGDARRRSATGKDCGGFLVLEIGAVDDRSDEPGMGDA